MRYDAEHKQNTHKKLLKIAADSIRAEGPHRIGVAAIMAKAGLTHGGFYAHFASKDELVAAAIEEMFEQSNARALHETEGLSARASLGAYIDFYLSRRHRDAQGSGCPIAALASDLPRMDDAVREQFAQGAKRLTATLARHLKDLGVAGTHSATVQAQADSMLAELVGALSLARAEPDRKRSDERLAASKQALKRRFNLEPGPAK
jgi:TetR/AcrR family transcriptional repressor of nem operon